MDWGRWRGVALLGLVIAAAILLVMSRGGGDGDPNAALECERLGYPCSGVEVPEDIWEESDRLSTQAAIMLEEGSTIAEVEAFLAEQPGMVEIDSEASVIRFRLDGGRGTWVIGREALGTRGGSASATAEPIPAPRGVSPLAFDIVGDESEEKSALVLSPFRWQFGVTDDGQAVVDILSNTRGYSTIDFAANDEEYDTSVGVGSFMGWEGYDVVHVVSHGFRLCATTPCRATIAAQTIEVADGEIEPQAGVEVLTPREIFVEQGGDLAKLEGDRGLGLLTARIVLLNADFFTNQYGGGLENAFVFFNACESYGSEATDLGDALRGSTSVFLGWSETVDTTVANLAAVKLYEDLSDGYAVEDAIARMEGLQTDPSNGATLTVGARAAGGDLHIRDVVMFVDGQSGEELTSTDTIPIVGTANDGEPDVFPWSARVDGMPEAAASETTLHVTLNGSEVAVLSVADGDANDMDQWTLSGTAELGHDLEEDEVVDLRVWVELATGGESDHEASPTITGGPIMGLEWHLESVGEIGHRGEGSTRTVSASLTLEFAPGQALDEPIPRYDVTGGTLIYHELDNTTLYCVRTAPERVFEVTPDMVFPSSPDDFSGSWLRFDTTVTPVEYFGVVLIMGPDDIITQDCDFSGVSDVNYGGNTTWLLAQRADHLPVTDPSRIEGSDLTGGDGGFFDLYWTLTRVR